MAAASKDTIYIDIDDEITSIIDKLRKSDHKIVALVLPKRATMLQSSVNMKLLKRAADGSKKHIVLITSEAGLLPLAASVGVHVAKTLQSKPEVPDVDDEADDVVDDSVEDTAEADSPTTEDDFNAKAAAAKPIGELAGMEAAGDVEETIDLDNTDAVPAVALTKADKKAAKQAKKKTGPKVPNFERFRLWLILGGVLIIVLIVGWIVANNVLPKATITVDTDTSSINSSQAIILDTAAKVVDPKKLTVPAKLEQTKKVTTQQVGATGQKNEGTKATGSVTMTAQECGAFTTPADVPAGTGLSSNSLTFITQQNTTFVIKNIKNGCGTFQATADTSVSSQNSGSQYNVSPSNFTVAGRSDVSASSGSAFTGGTDNIIKVVAQTDIDSAKQKLGSQDTGPIKTALQTSLQTAGYYAVTTTFTTGTPTVTTSANAGDQADTVTVTETTNYTMFGAKQSDLQSIIDADVTKQIDPSKQAILDDGISKVSFNITTQTATTAQLTMQSTATAGPHLDVDKLKSQIAGKKSGQVKTIISANPGVTSVTVHFSPFWVDATPKKTSKVTIQFVKTNQANANGN